MSYAASTHRELVVDLRANKSGDRCKPGSLCDQKTNIWKDEVPETARQSLETSTRRVGKAAEATKSDKSAQVSMHRTVSGVPKTGAAANLRRQFHPVRKSFDSRSQLLQHYVLPMHVLDDDGS